ncbi:MAG: metal-dependent hydrolase [Terracidiphilus sp.]
MEPLTHLLTGACIGRAGLNRKTAYATLAAVLAAAAADLDTLWGFAGPVEGLKHHRGFTHTFIGAPVVAAVVVGAIWLLHRWREARRTRSVKSLAQNAKALTTPTPRPSVQPVRWWWLYFTALIAALSHILLDWTNNYGVRPFFPFNSRWYAGSFMFIAEPVVWALLLLALVMPWLLGLTDREIGARARPFRGRDWAIFALAGMAALGCLRWWEHAQAINLARNAGVVAAPIERVAAEPYPVNPFRWHVLFETASFYQTAEVNSWTGSVDSDPERDTIYKPTVTAAVEAAKKTFLGRVYLDWGKWAVVRDMGQEPAPGMVPPRLPRNRAKQTWTTVKFTDLRFDYPFLAGRSASASTPLTGWVYIVDGREDAGEAMDGREQR